MDFETWAKAPSIDSGSLEAVSWALAFAEVDHPARPQDLARGLLAAGWTRVITSRGRVWYAPGKGGLRFGNEPGLRNRIVMAIRAHFAEHPETTMLEAHKAARQATGYNKPSDGPDLIARALVEMMRAEEIIAGGLPKGPDGKSNPWGQILTHRKRPKRDPDQVI